VGVAVLNGRRSRGASFASFCVGAAVCLSLASPLVARRGVFCCDWANSLWLLQAAPRLGSLYVHNRHLGLSYPVYAFYGGPLYELANLMSRLIGGHPVAVYIGMWSAGIGADYACAYGFSRRVGLRRAQAHLPAIALVTAPYFLTNIYGRGAFSEFTATAAIPVVLYSAFLVLTAERPPRWAVPGLLAALAVMTGSHMITLVYGGMFLALVAGGVAVVYRDAVVDLVRHRRRRLALVGGAVLLAVALNGWYLVPGLMLGRTTSVAVSPVPPSSYAWLTTPAMVLHGLPAVARGSSTRALYVQLPLVLIVWALAAVVYALARRAYHRPLGPVLLVAGLAGCAVAVTSGAVWDALPVLFWFIQFPYRLLTYADLLVAGLVTVALVSLRRLAPRPRAVLGAAGLAAAAFALGVATWQVWTSPSLHHSRTVALRGTMLLPATWYDDGIYRNASLPVVNVAPDRTADLDPGRADPWGGWRGTVALPPGPGPVATDLGAGPGLVTVHGVRLVGRTKEGWLVVVRQPGDERPVVPIEVRPRWAGAQGVGLAVSGTALVVLLGLMAGAAIRTAQRLDFAVGPSGPSPSEIASWSSAP
jgi:hypothetical protein